LSYEERLERYGLTTLEELKSRGYLIKAYKIMTGREALQWERLIVLALSKATHLNRYK